MVSMQNNVIQMTEDGIGAPTSTELYKICVADNIRKIYFGDNSEFVRVHDRMIYRIQYYAIGLDYSFLFAEMTWHETHIGFGFLRN